MKRFDFNFGAEVQGKEGQCGKLAGLVVQPETRQVTDLIVKKGFLFTQDRIVPISVVQSAMEDNVHLSITDYELDQYPEYRVKEYEQPATGLGQQTVNVATPYGYATTEPTVPMVKQKIREGLVPGQEVIEKGMEVKNIEGTIGKVEHVVVDRESQKMTDLVAHRGMLFGDRIIIPVSMVEDLHEEGIFISCTNEEVEQLPRYMAEQVDLVK